MKTLSVCLWFLVSIYGFCLTFWAVRELSGRSQVQGLLRSYSSPYEIDLGTVYDPREGSLKEELRTRYLIDLKEEPEKTMQAWKEALEALQVETLPCSEIGDALWPRLWFNSEIALQVGTYGRSPMIFLPQFGMILARSPIKGDCLALRVRGEKPW